MIEALSAEHRTYALDHIFDNGRSIYTRPLSTPDDFVQWLDELFDALELKNLNLMGHSYGGWQASLYALAHPERLATLMLLAPAATVLPPPFGLIARALISYFIPTRFITKRSLYWYAPDAVDKANTRAPHLNLKLAAPPSIAHRVRTSRDPLRRRSARLQSAR